MWSVLTYVCRDSNLVISTQKISVPPSPSAEICMCVGMHEYYVPRKVCGLCVLIMTRSNLLILFWFLESISLVCYFLGEK